MAKPGGTFRSNIPAVAGAVDDSKRNILNQIAHQAEALAKQNIIKNDTVDTGFMGNATHALTTSSDGVPAETQIMTDQDGRQVERRSNGLPTTDDDTSAVGCGADYAIFVELNYPFIGPAGQDVIDDVPGIIARNKVK